MKKLMMVLALILASAMVFAEDSWESIYAKMSKQLEELQASEKEKMPNDIQRRKNWVQLLDECKESFKNRSALNLSHDPALEYGKVNYKTETQDISFKALLQWDNAAYSILYDLNKGLNATGKAREWGVSVRVPDLPYDITASLINGEGKVIGKTKERFGGMSGPLGNTNTRLDSPALTFGNFDLGGKPMRVTFEEVNANDVTDTLTVTIDTVNGIASEEAERTGYTHIASENLSEDAFKSPWGYFRVKRIGNFLVSPAAHNGVVLQAYYLPDGKYPPVIDIPAYIDGKSVMAVATRVIKSEVNLGPYAGHSYQDSKNICKLVLPDTLEYLYENSIQYEGITELVIPKSIVHIGGFAQNGARCSLTQISLPADLSDANLENLRNSDVNVGRLYSENGKKAGTYYRGSNFEVYWDLKTW